MDENEMKNDEFLDEESVEESENMESGDILDKLREAEEAAAQNYDRYMRTLAEFDNFRKRTIKEKASLFDDGVISVLTKLLPAIDNIERAVSFCGEGERNTQFFAGIEMILKQIADVMNQLDVTAIDAAGERFDPDFHSAIAHVDDEGYGEGEIIEDLLRGYMYKDKVLRHSAVKVAN